MAISSKSTLRLLPALALAFGPGLAVLLLAWAGLLERGERPVYDWLLSTRRAPPSGRVFIVVIDDDTFGALGNRNPDRGEIATVLSSLWERKPALIGIDLLFSSPKDEALDARFEEVLARTRCVLACNQNKDRQPIVRFRKRAAGVGFIDFVTDRDGILRSLLPPYADLREDPIVLKRLPFALECARRVWFGDEAPEVSVTARGYRFGNHLYRLSRGVHWIPFCGGDGTIDHASFLSVLRDPGGLPDLKDRVVLLGNAVASEHDLFSVPLSKEAGRVAGFAAVATRSMAGVEIHAQSLDALLSGRTVAPLPERGVALLLTLLGLAAAGLALLPLKPLPSLATWAAGALLILGFALGGVRQGAALPLFSMGMVWGAYGASSFGYHRYRDFSARRAVEQLFGRYVSPNIAKQLLSNPGLVHPGGRKKELTILFSDVRGFTSLSERIPPEQVTEILNLYFTEMMTILFAHDGTYDKFIGDALLAFFGDPVDQPDQAERALACAVAMQARAATLRGEFEAAGRPPIRIGVAIHTGPVIVGNHGSKENWSYTVIGDTVNLASRLQGLAQKDEVILSAETASRIPGLRERYLVEELEPVKVKGKSEPIPILKVTGFRTRTEVRK